MAHYAESLLASGEHLVRIQRQHWLTILDAAKEAVLGLVVTVVLFFLGGALPADGGGAIVRQALGLVTLAILVLSLLRLGWTYLRWSTDEYVLTNRRVMQVQGIINKRTTDSSLEKINDAVLIQSWLGRVLGFGDLDILTAAEPGIERMRMLVDAAGFKKGMLEAKHELELELSRGGVPSPALRAPGPMVPVGERRPSREPTPVPPPAVPGTAAGLDGRDVTGVVATPPTETSTPPRSARAMTADEVTETLARLADLRDRGAVTPEEFEAKKRDLLDRL